MFTMRGYVAVILAALSCFCIFNRSFAQLPPPISISNLTSFRLKSPSDIKTVEDAMAAVITIASKDLGLPLVEPLYIHLHPDTNSFAAHAGKYGRRLAPTTTQFAIAVAEENRFHVNMEKARGRPWSALIWTLAHEYTHNVEYVFSSLYRGSQWLREGFADWVAAKVLHHLGWQDHSTTVHRSTLEVRRLRAFLPALTELEESNRWSVWANHPNGGILTYRFAFLAVDKLLSRAGATEMRKYFATQDFQTNFGVSWNQFEKEFKAALSESRTPNRIDGKAEKPDWKIGHQWHYAWKAPGRSGMLARELVREEIFEGQPTYVLKAGDSESFHAKESLGLLATATKGTISTRQSAAHELFSWPLESGREWKTAFARENPAQKSSAKLAYVKVIASVEEIGVPARNFEAFKIESYGSDNGRLLTEQWYAPAVKWFVKIREYFQDGVREEELIKFNLD